MGFNEKKGKTWEGVNVNNSPRIWKRILSLGIHTCQIQNTAKDSGDWPIKWVPPIKLTWSWPHTNHTDINRGAWWEEEKREKNPKKLINIMEDNKKQVIVLQRWCALLSIFALISSSQSFDYGEALSKSLLYFESQRSGRLPYNQRVTWRHHSGLTDGLEQGVSPFFHYKSSIYTGPCSLLW